MRNKTGGSMSFRGNWSGNKLSGRILPAHQGRGDAQYANPSDSVLKLELLGPARRTETERATLSEWFRSHASSELKQEQDRYYANCSKKSRRLRRRQSRNAGSSEATNAG